ncbi:AlpA family phage regulatory protein [Chromobacterium sp. ASV23]|uniref:AlpA family phage regulatory protein n=1 Tax=Chromobacterium sp. ASV23 TaxID=2795110 RepID=UPI001E50F113|nr:AlpA family phage regulatory protein [Chromobacterium sp. ASV23]
MTPYIDPKLAILRRKEVEKKIGLSRSTIYALMDAKSPYHDPSFPKPISLGAKAVGWIETELDSWLYNRMNSRFHN